MGIVFDTTQIPPTDRVELIREVIWDSLVRVEIQHQPEATRVAAQGQITDVGQLKVCSVRSNATKVRRTHSLARDEMEPSLFVGLQLSGSSMVVQGDREATLRPGDLYLFDTTMPYTLLNDHGIDQHYFRVPRRELALPTAVVERVTALRMTAANPVVDLASAYLQRLATNATAASVTDADAMARPSIELIRAVIATQLGDRRLASGPLESTLELRILEYVRAHLSDHDLTAARIAHKHNISVRQLYTILARAGICLGEWIRVHRLEECRRELAQPQARRTTIAAVAHRWGFADATHFSRVFRDAYGMSPREWRNFQLGKSHC
ncbi:AraC-like ligand-binding domain-containing protein [Nocardia brasiliensis]